VVCSYNGSRTLRDCLDGVSRIEYPDYEVIVVDDGSTDATSAIAGEYLCRLVRTPNRGLSSARNTGIEHASGEIVAFTDDDARPDPHWLRYLASAFRNPTVAAVGGPNVAPAGDGWIAACVANAPGRPDARARIGSGSRAHSRLQHGVPQVRARRDRRLRPPLSRGG
jgi:glycosyltransferase involved in cell wall biosynthesis